MHDGARYRSALELAACCLALMAVATVRAAPPTFETVFPLGAQQGQTLEIEVTGSELSPVGELHCSAAGVRSDRLDTGRFRLTLPPTIQPGLHDLWLNGGNGISAARTFAVGNRPEVRELEPNDTGSSAMPVGLDYVVNGRIDQAGDQDQFQFVARRGQRVILECWAERLDSRLRAVLEVFDATGRRLAANRGYFGIDPLIAFCVPEDGSYLVKVHDLTAAGGVEHSYRLTLDTGPRVVCSVPNVVPRNQASRVTLLGWNLTPNAAVAGETVASAKSDTKWAACPDADFERLEVEIPSTLARDEWPLLVGRLPAQAVVEGFNYALPGSSHPIVIGVTDLPVALETQDHQSPETAQAIDVPCEISGQLVQGDECDWYAVQARRGEVVFVEGWGQRVSSPVDLQVSLHDASGQHVLAEFTDEVRAPRPSFPTQHFDPAGRWVAPADGSYLIAIRNLVGGVKADPRRVYRLSVYREQPDCQLIVVPSQDAPAGLTLARGGREPLDVVAFRRRGADGSIRVSAASLPPGVRCPDVWLGPGVDRATLMVAADSDAEFGRNELQLAAEMDGVGRRAVRAGTIVRTGTPHGWARLTAQLPLSVSGAAPLRITADAHEPLNHHLYGKLQVRHSPGSILDVAVQIQRVDPRHQADVRLLGVGLPSAIQNQTAVVPAGSRLGHLSFYLPPTLTAGNYSLAVRAETTVPTADQSAAPIVVFSNSVNFTVYPAAFRVEVDPFAVERARRGEVIQVSYTAERLNGFIGKLHTELATPGCVTDVVGLRGRGETLVGQGDRGSLQIIVNDNAPLGQLPFLRLFTVGVVEDVPTYFGSRFLKLEVVE